MSRYVWEDLSDSELRARLGRRLGERDTGMLVANRDDPEVAAVIEKALNP